MTTMKRISALALALVFMLALVALPAAANALSVSIVKQSGPSDYLLLDFNGGAVSGSRGSLKLIVETTGTPSSGTPTWVSNDPSIASIGVSDGVCTVTPVGVGKTYISVSVDGVSASYEVTVKQETKIETNPANLTLDDGTPTAKISATLYPAAAKQKLRDMGLYINWSTTNAGVATVSPSSSNSEDQVTVTKGATFSADDKIIASVNSFDYYIGSNKEVDLTANSNKPYLTISGSGHTYTDWMTYPNAVTVTLHNDSAEYPLNSRVEWYSSNSSVVKVTGLSTNLASATATATVQTLANGTANITAKVINPTNGGYALSTNTYKITVEKPVPTIKLTTDTNELNASRRTAYLTVAVSDPTGSVSSNGAIRMTSSNSRMTSVSAGTVYMSGFYAYPYAYSHYNGTATITARIAGTQISDSVSLTTTGLSYLPQTGQDGTVLYVIGGLCLLMFVAAGALYIRRKKNIEG